MITLKKIKVKLSSLLIIISLMASGTLAYGAENNSLSTSTTREMTASEKAHAEQLISRIHEIASMNKKELDKDQKSQLKKEVTGIKKELKELGGGVYISATLLVVILILIILL